MKATTIVIALLALIIATVQAASVGSNAERMARGLPPRAPRKLYRETPTGTQAKRSKPSGTPSCSTGPVQCCDSTEKADGPIASILLALLGILGIGDNVLVGITCSPISVIGIGGGGSCSAQTVCCQDNSHGGLISIGCIPITL